MTGKSYAKTRAHGAGEWNRFPGFINRDFTAKSVWRRSPVREAINVAPMLEVIELQSAAQVHQIPRDARECSRILKEEKPASPWDKLQTVGKRHG